ncbi:MAG TPA: archease [Methylomirabilota bacterium]|nr:archease [Methylomirabilota bacterium]
MTVAGYEYYKVAADVGVRAWGSTLAVAFAEVARGVLALAIAPEEVVERDRREVRAQGETAETLLVNWVNECLYVHEVEGFATHRVEVTTFAGGLVHGLLHGEEIDPRRHRAGTGVKAATSQQASVHEGPGGIEIHLILDV